MLTLTYLCGDIVVTAQHDGKSLSPWKLHVSSGTIARDLVATNTAFAATMALSVTDGDVTPITNELYALAKPLLDQLPFELMFVP